MDDSKVSSVSSKHLRKIAQDVSSGEEELSDEKGAPDNNQDWEETEDDDIDFSNIDSYLRQQDVRALSLKVDEVNQKIDASAKKKTDLGNPLKVLVSKQKRRFKLDGFDLDLTYVTERIIAMGYPAESFEAMYRNSMRDVVKFFNARHENHYKIYNLCAERKYKHSHFNNMVAEFPFEDHQAPTFSLIYEFCIDLNTWFRKHEANVAGIHCKAGKGRTGVMICCYLLFSKIFTNAYDALKYYGMIRTKNKKGVTIPSQIRYIHYFEKALKTNWTMDSFPMPTILLTKIKLITIPNFNMMGGCEPSFIITNKDFQFKSKDHFKTTSYKSEAFIEFPLNDIILKGDTLLEFYNSSLLKKEKMFQCWFCCSFFDQSGVMVIDKFMLDKANKDKSHKKFSKDFMLELYAKYEQPAHLKSKKENELIQMQKNAPSKFEF